jgi:hypothetical protein
MILTTSWRSTARMATSYRRSVLRRERLPVGDRLPLWRDVRAVGDAAGGAGGSAARPLTSGTKLDLLGAADLRSERFRAACKGNLSPLHEVPGLLPSVVPSDWLSVADR